MASILDPETDQKGTESCEYSLTYKQIAKYIDPEGNVVEFNYLPLKNHCGSGIDENPGTYLPAMLKQQAQWTNGEECAIL